jgi:hypothetical protein
VTAAQAAKLKAASPDHGGSHEAMLKAIARYKRASDPRASVGAQDLPVLRLIESHHGLRTAELQARMECSYSRAQQHLSRLVRQRLIYSLVSREKGATGFYGKSVRWYPGTAPKRLAAH